MMLSHPVVCPPTCICCRTLAASATASLSLAAVPLQAEASPMSPGVDAANARLLSTNGPMAEDKRSKHEDNFRFSDGSSVLSSS